MGGTPLLNHRVRVSVDPPVLGCLCMAVAFAVFGMSCAVGLNGQAAQWARADAHVRNFFTHKCSCFYCF